MSPVPFAKDKNYFLLGLGLSGLSTLKALRASGAHVYAWDDGEAARTQATELDVTVIRPEELDWTTIDAVITSPGIPYKFPEPHIALKLAAEHNIPFFCDIELFYRANSDKNLRYIGITGTNGKSTTTALTGHILKMAKKDAHVGGNIGVPIFELKDLKDDSIIILELSSFQLELIDQLSLEIGAILNIKPDHLESHGGFEGYQNAKKIILEKSLIKIIGLDDAPCRTLYQMYRAKNPETVYGISGESPLSHGVYIQNNQLIDCQEDHCTLQISTSGATNLQGKHNWQNITCAYAICKYLNLKPEEIERGLNTFPGLIHRQQILGSKENVLFVNDSKATNIDATIQALNRFKNIFWIVGGRTKEPSFTPLRSYLARVHKAYAIGETTDKIADELGSSLEVEKAYSLDTAFEKAYADAKKSGFKESVVLLAPSCTSYDQYKNFEERGLQFIRLVEKIKGSS